MKTYINGMGCISAQPTFEGAFASGFSVSEDQNVLPVVAPPYKDYFSPIAARRMAKGVKNGIVASSLALREANLELPGAIITGTGMGCIEDSDKFLKAIIDNQEQFLTPTSFIQSTHNTVAAQIALGLQCKAYNFTYVNAAVSFESALLDGKLQLEEGGAASVLIGGIDEMTDYTASLFKLAGFIKKDAESTFALKDSKTSGTVFSEGATFFVIENKASESSYAEVVDVEIINSLSANEVSGKAEIFLAANQLSAADIDLLIVGKNGDASYENYDTALASGLFANTAQAWYKHVSGEYNTASAFGLYAAANMVKEQKVPEILNLNGRQAGAIRYALLYNQYRGIDHSFTLIKKV